MEQLNGIDASFLNMETATAHSHVGSLALFDPSEVPMTIDTVKKVIAERLHEIPPYRRRLMTVPLGLDRPYWIEDDAFDLDFHIRHIAVPAPGDRYQLADLVARLHSRPLDRAKPLWELYVIEGLDTGLVAHYTKIHHACIDGVTGTEILTHGARRRSRGTAPQARGHAVEPRPGPEQPRDARPRGRRHHDAAGRAAALPAPHDPGRHAQQPAPDGPGR